MVDLCMWRRRAGASWWTFVSGGGRPENHGVPLSLAAEGRSTMVYLCLWRRRAGAPRWTFVSGRGGPEHHGKPLSLLTEGRSSGVSC